MYVSLLFPVGNSSSSYTPATILNTGTNDQFSVRVGEGVTTAGRLLTSIDTGNVNRTWYISENETGGSNGQITLQWNGIDEQQGSGGFDRTQSYISHFVVCPPPDPPHVCGGSFYDAVARTAALGNDPYTQTRNNVTSFNSNSFIVTSRVPQMVYTFINMNTNGPGDGNWNNSLNWSNGLIPPTTIIAGMEVIIDPATGQCNTGPLTVMPGGKVTVKPGKILNIQ